MTGKKKLKTTYRQNIRKNERKECKNYHRTITQ